MSRMRKLLFFSSFVLVSLAGFSQNLERYNWYFGGSPQAIRFNRTSAKPSVVSKALPFGSGGSGTASDPSNANLLFYTDGQFVYDATHLQMPAGFGLNANTNANQPVAICPVPGPANQNKYFIFTNSGNFTAGGTISVTVVDMNQFGNAAFPSPPLGDIESKNTGVPGLPNRSEAMTIVPDLNGTDFWLLTQQVSSQSYSATHITAASYTGTFVTTTTGNLGFPTTSANFSYQVRTNPQVKVAVSSQDPGTDAMVLDFDRSTGIFSNPQIILNSGMPTTTNQSIYDIEWSANGQYLYLSRYGEPGITADVLQYDMLNPSISLTSVLPVPVFRSFGLQMGPDSVIYHLYQAAAAGPILLGKISKPDTIASQVNYLAAQLSAATFNGTQFPAFATQTKVNLTVDFTFIGTCQNNNTTFFPDIVPAADSVRWDFGDGSGSNAWSPVHKFTQPLAFNVTLTAYYRGDSSATTNPVNITAFPLQLNLVQDTTACRSEFPPPRGTASPKAFSVKVNVTGGNPVSYTWSNGDTGPILTPDSAGYYYVVVADASGCSAYAGVNVKEYGLQDQRSNIWYFGNKAGIDFNPLPNPPKALDNSAMTAPEGCAIICDRNGNTIFYTDGDNVYNKNDVLLTSAIGGDPLASQSSIIVPVPGDETLYYIFTNEAINGTSTNTVRYSLFDLKLNGGLGAVVKQGLTLFSRSTERITASGNWLIVHEYGNNTFRVYPITAGGIGDPVLTAIGSDHNYSPKENGEGYMKLGPKNTLAVALSNPGVSNFIELFHLNDTTGKLTNYRKIDLKHPAGQVYGVEFSSGGNKVYATVKGSPSPSTVFEYFIDSIGHPYLRNPPTVQNAELGALQKGPDGQIYMAINGSSVLATIQPVEDTTRVSPINFSGFTLAAGTQSTLGLPNFIQQINNATGGPALDFTGVCLGSPTKFVGSATDAIDKFLWFFGDGGSDTDAAPSHTYGAVGTYSVSMNLTNRCGLDTTLVKPVTIFAPPQRPTIPGATALCNGPVLLDANTGNLPGLTYLWTGGITTKTITVSLQSIVSVTLTDVNGCTSNGTTLVADNQPQLDLGPDITLCQNAFTTALDAQNPGANYAWTVNGASPTSAQVRPIDTTLPGTFTYSVVVTDPITTCTVTDQTILTIVASPSFTLGGTNPTGCGVADGTLTLNLATTVPATGPYSYFITGPGAFNQQAIDQTAPQVLNFNLLAAGTYSGVVNDQVSGCTISQSFGLSSAPPGSASALPVTFCDPEDIQVTTSLAFPLQYQVTNNGTGVVTGPTAAAGPSPFNLATPLSAGTYTIQLTSGTCVFTINNYVVAPNAPLAMTVTPGVCATPPTITASGAPGVTYAWTGPGIVSGANSATVTISGQGQFTYSVTGSLIGNCPNTQPITVVLDNPTPSFTQSDPCQNTIQLTASPSGNYTYRWYKAGVIQPALQGQFISLGLTENGASYQTETFNTLNGCAVKSSPATLVQVFGQVDASISSTPACDDNKPFTITATTSATAINYSWFKNNVLISGETSPTISQTDAATYKVEISKTSSATCKAAASLTIVKAPLPRGTLPNREIICNDPGNQDPKTNQVDLNPGKFAAYDWFKNELSLNYKNQVFTADSQGKYRVDLTNSFGCKASDETDVRNECLPIVEAPNAFRPGSTVANTDDPSLKNSEFWIMAKFIKDGSLEVFIYSRWGELVYHTNDAQPNASGASILKWNGGYNGAPNQPLPSGSYSYVIRYVSSFHPERGVLEKRGGVALLK